MDRDDKIKLFMVEFFSEISKMIRIEKEKIDNGSDTSGLENIANSIDENSIKISLTMGETSEN